MRTVTEIFNVYNYNELSEEAKEKVKEWYLDDEMRPTFFYEDKKEFLIEENVILMLEAKRNGFQGVPDVVDLVHNEEYKENALYEFSEKLRGLF